MIKFENKFMLLVLFMCFQTYSQSGTEYTSSSKLGLIENVKSYAIHRLGMNFSKSFYSSWAKNEKPNYYLYVSKRDSLIQPIDPQRPYMPFGHNIKEAKIQKDSYDQLGYSTLLYQTYGTAASKLSNHLLSYSEESIAFIAFHEATHQHIRRTSEIPYLMVEALCDIVGNYGTLDLFSEDQKLSKRKAKKQIECIEHIVIEINRLINFMDLQNTNELQLDDSKLQRRIRELKKNKDKFKIERYDYEINSAYLLRNRSYTKYYFKLKTLLNLIGDLREFIHFMTLLPNSESECVLQIEKKIKTLTGSKG